MCGIEIGSSASAIPIMSDYVALGLAAQYYKVVDETCIGVTVRIPMGEYLTELRWAVFFHIKINLAENARYRRFGRSETRVMYEGEFKTKRNDWKVSEQYKQKNISNHSRTEEIRNE